MRQLTEVILAALIVFTRGTRVVSFLSTFNAGRGIRADGLRTSFKHKTLHLAYSEMTRDTPLSRNPLPPEDETFSPVGALTELLAAPVPPASCGRFDGVGKNTGGIWRSCVLGFMPSTILAWPLADKWIAQQETAGNVVLSFPESIKKLFGPKALTSLVVPSKRHVALMGAFDRALSPKAIMKLLPAIEASMERIVVRWEKVAASGQEVTMLDDIKGFTLETICGGLLGHYATQSVRDDIARLLPVFAKGVISIPIQFGWPLNLFPMFRYDQSLKARKELVQVLRSVVRRRKDDIAQPNDADSGGRHAGVVDGFLKIRLEQEEAGGSGPEIDDDFIADNVIAALFGGYDTTAAVISRIVQTLGSDEGKGIVNELSKELSTVITSNEETLRHGPTGNLPKGILKAFPLLESVFLESYRLTPNGPGVFRKVVQETSYNGYRIPSGESILWDTSLGCRSASLYPEPNKFCPFRFLHRGSSNHGTASAEKTQPHPQPFGFGVHMCRGRELAKLEMLIFFREFLSRFEFDLVEGQDFDGEPPANAPKDGLRVRLKVKGELKA